MGSLPAELTSFVGRRREAGEIRRSLSAARLVTLTGVGGVGKTRLALRVAHDLRRAFPDGVWFVGLNELRDGGPFTQDLHDPELLAHLVAASLGIREQSSLSSVEVLKEYLAARRLLLVLDNCEHLVDTVASLVNELLMGCPHLRLLATSREPLKIAGEALYVVPPLAVPEAHGLSTFSELSQCESVALFVSRGQAAMAGFQLGAGNQAAVAELCRQVEGLPLAIELAAARLRALAPDQILERFGDRFTMLSRGSRTAPERQQTLRACVDWSFELCAKAERILWSRLSVFAGEFELDAAQGICTDDVLPEAELLDLIAGLVDKSILISNDHEPVVRYRMLETLRAYGAGKQLEAGEHLAVHRRHRDWYQRLVELAHREWISDRQAYWLRRLGREHSNLRAAVEHCLAEPGGGPAALRIVVSVPTLYWWAHGLVSEGRRWLERGLAQADAPTVLRARALLLTSHLAIAQGDTDAGIRLLEEGTDLATRLGATAEMAYATHNRGLAALFSGDLPAAAGLLDEASAILTDAPDAEPQLQLNLLHSSGVAAALIGDHQRVARCHRDTLAITEPAAEDFYRSKSMWVCGLAAWRQGDLREAAAQGLESLRIKQARQLDDRYGVAQCVELLAWTAAGEQRYGRAATLLGAADTLRADMGIPISSLGHLIAYHDACERQSRDSLGDQAFAHAVHQGQRMTSDETLTFALQQPSPAPSSGRQRSTTALTRREQEIAELVAQGLSNKEIAARLVISQRTAESHVERILTKLNFSSRTQVAAWVAHERANDS